MNSLKKDEVSIECSFRDYMVSPKAENEPVSSSEGEAPGEFKSNVRVVVRIRPLL